MTDCVLLVDDHSVVRKGVRYMIESGTDSVDVGEANTAAEALSMIRSRAWGAVLLDLSLPDRPGLDLLKQVHREWPNLPVLVLSVHPEEQYGLRVLKTGAWGYLQKTSPPEVLLEAISSVLANKRYVSPRLAERLALAAADGIAQQAHDALSDREYEVLQLMANGKTPAEIADELCLSVKTVHTYRSRMLRKMGLNNNMQLVHYALTNNLVDF